MTSYLKDLIMKKNKILQSDYLDILFDGRNKSYGGYALRKSQDKRYARSMAVMLALCISIITYSVVGKVPAEVKGNPKMVETIIRDIELPPMKEIKPEVKEVKPPAQKKTEVKTVKNTPPVIKKDNEVKEDEKPPEQSELKNAVVGNKNIEGDSTDSDVSIVGTGDGEVLGTDTKEVEIPKYVAQMPETNYDLMAYLNRHINYPTTAKESGIDGRVLVQFVVNEDGSISNATTVGRKVFGGGLEEEAIRVVSAMPKWKPGRQNGKAVKVYFTLPINFRLE